MLKKFRKRIKMMKKAGETIPPEPELDRTFLGQGVLTGSYDGTVQLWSLVDGMAKKEHPSLLREFAHPRHVSDPTPPPTWRGWGPAPRRVVPPPLCPSPVQPLTADETSDLLEEFHEKFPAKPKPELAAALLPRSLGDWVTAVEFATPTEVATPPCFFPTPAPWSKSAWGRGQVEDDGLFTTAYTEMVSASWDNSVRIWELETGRCTQELLGHTDGVRCLCLEGDRIISGGMDRAVRVWRRDGTCEHILMGHKASDAG